MKRELNTISSLTPESSLPWGRKELQLKSFVLIPSSPKERVSVRNFVLYYSTILKIK